MCGAGNFLVVGLGNIGREYDCTRHNMGFMILDSWARESNIIFSTDRYGDLASLRLKGRGIHLLKPSTYMNLSGNAVRYWMQKLSIPLSNVAIVCDDINLPFGTLRMRPSGSDGGHNGLKNIEECLESRSFTRIRCGVGHDFGTGHQIDYVLSPLSEEELKQIDELRKRIVSGIQDWIFLGPDRAMNTLNAKK